MKKTFINIVILISLSLDISIANECALGTMDNLLKINQQTLRVIDNTYLLKSNNDEQVEFFYSKKTNELKLIKYKGFASTYNLEIDYYVGLNGNLLVQISTRNYTDFVNSKTLDIFSRKIAQFPLCNHKGLNDLNYGNSKEDYELALKIRKRIGF